jgi:hypothetical protein
MAAHYIEINRGQPEISGAFTGLSGITRAMLNVVVGLAGGSPHVIHSEKNLSFLLDKRNLCKDRVKCLNCARMFHHLRKKELKYIKCTLESSHRGRFLRPLNVR